MDMKIRDNGLERKFRCAKCGYLTQRQAPPRNCPICKAGSEVFEDIGRKREDRMFRSSVLLISFGVLGLVLVMNPAKCFATASTHIWAPSTDVQAYGVVHVTADMYPPVGTDSAGNRPATVTNEGLTVGTLPFEKFNIETGFDHKTGLGDLDDYPIYFNAKGGIPEGAFGEWFPALAVGAYDLGTKTDRTDFNIIYGKAAKTFKIKDFNLGRLSLGYFNGNSKLLLGPNGNKDNDGVFGAWERSMTEISDKLWLCAEYQGTRSSYGAWTFGGSWKFSDNASMIVGYSLYNNRNLADTVTIQVDLDFDAFSKLFKKK